MKLRPLKNYTLLEIMVVIAIIIILCTMLFGGFTQIKEMAKRTKCLNKVKDVSHSVQTLTGEYGHIPLAQTFVIERDRSEDVGEQIQTVGISVRVAMLCYWGLGQGDGSIAATAKFMMDGTGEGSHKSGYWRLVCDNPVAAWCSRAYDLQQFANVEIQERRPQITIWAPMYTGFLDYCNERKSSIVASVVGTSSITGKQYVDRKSYGVLYPSEVKSPSDRVYAVEGGEKQDSNNYADFQRQAFGRAINAGSYGSETNTSDGYTSGMGGGGIGKESREAGGFTARVTSRENFAEIEQDVMTGRHNGYVMHAFFDGSARAITADEVGRNQAPPEWNDAENRFAVTSKVTGLYRSPLLGGGDGAD